MGIQNAEVPERHSKCYSTLLPMLFDQRLLLKEPPTSLGMGKAPEGHDMFKFTNYIYMERKKERLAKPCRSLPHICSNSNERVIRVEQSQLGQT